MWVRWMLPGPRFAFIWVRERADARPYSLNAERHVCPAKPET